MKMQGKIYEFFSVKNSHYFILMYPLLLLAVFFLQSPESVFSEKHIVMKVFYLLTIALAFPLIFYSFVHWIRYILLIGNKISFTELLIKFFCGALGMNLLLVSLYTLMYFHFSAIDGIEVSKHDAFYFSVVTYTTLGYGDLHPKESFRLLAASEAFVGYLMLGLMVGALISVVMTSQKK